MIENVPSRTALRVSMRRAAHQLLDDPLVFDDPLAVGILGSEQAAAMRANPRQFEEGPFALYLRAFFAMRSRVAEDTLAECVAAGVRQCVILGAGLDTFGYRNPFPALRVFEVDHPATQAWKRDLLAESHIEIPESVAFAAVDFACDSLTDALSTAGCRADEPTFFSWLGVVPYLTPEDVFKTLTTIAPMAAGGGGVVFDYGVPPESLPPLSRAAVLALAARVAAAGEPFRGYFDPTELLAQIRALGFRDVRDLDPDELNAQFFSNRADGMKVGSAGRILIARG